MSSMPDTAQSLAVVAACAAGRSLIAGLGTLRIKETDRLAALVAELEKIGAQARVDGDRLSVDGAKVRGGRICTYRDHRMAMSFAMLGARVAGMQIENPEVVSKSFPEFWDRLRGLGVGVA